MAEIFLRERKEGRKETTGKTIHERQQEVWEWARIVFEKTSLKRPNNRAPPHWWQNKVGSNAQRSLLADLLYNHEAADRREDSYAPQQPVGPNTHRNCARKPPSSVLNSTNFSQEPVVLLTVFCSPAYQTCYHHNTQHSASQTRVQGK